MKKEFIASSQDTERGEEQLAVLIQQAGDAARAKKREVMDKHFNKLRDIVKKALSHKQGSLPT